MVVVVGCGSLAMLGHHDVKGSAGQWQPATATSEIEQRVRE